MDQQTIVVVGASGAVGSMIVKLLAAKENYKLILAGRRKAPLDALNNALNSVASVVAIDIRQPDNFEFLQSAHLLIMCVDIENDVLPRACIAHGVHYMDISASATVFNLLQQLDTAAMQQKTSLLFSVGLAPGLTNILAKHLLSKMPSATNLELYVLLGLGEAHGEYAYQWTFDNLHKTYPIQDRGKQVPLKSFTSRKTTQLAGKMCDFYLFDFVDQHILSHTNPAATVRTRLAFDNNFFTNAVALMRKLGLTKIYRNRKVQQLMMKMMQRVELGADLYGVKAMVSDENGKELSASVTGNAQGKITAIVAAQLVPLLLNSTASGLMHSHDLIADVPAFLEDLKKQTEDLSFEIVD